MKLIPLPAFQDNDPWVSHGGRQARVSAAGDAQPVLACLQHDRLQVEAILVTHPGPDHSGRVHALHDASPHAAAVPVRPGRWNNEYT